MLHVLLTSLVPGHDLCPAQKVSHVEDMRTRRYQIIISGRLGAVCCEAFPDFHIAPHGTDTALTGDLTRSGLHDALTRIRDLALDLVGITCLAPELARVPGASGPRGAFTEPGPGKP